MVRFVCGAAGDFRVVVFDSLPWPAPIRARQIHFIPNRRSEAGFFLRLGGLCSETIRLKTAEAATNGTSVCRLEGPRPFGSFVVGFSTVEFIDGEDLASLLKRIDNLRGAKALDVARQLCAGLAAVHDKRVLHRDLKPAHVMLDGHGRVRVTDFLAGDGGELPARMHRRA